MGSSNNLSSDDKLLLAAIDLIAEKGYNGVSTKEIAAAAGLSEKTLFRHFGSKQNLLETAFDRFHYTEEMKKLFNEKLVWDLHADLLLISRTYHEIMNRNRKMIQISIKEEGNLPGFRERTQKHPQQLMEILTNYFTAMSEKGKLIRTNPEMQAFSFMMMNFGAFMNNLDADANFPTVSMEAFIMESVQIFARALTP
ncbi:TetR/AcrR family transcriptional regulator [Aneurinibacillus migulanus]|uniref:Transcriptional regulator n=1 Tax=Aneurinibacillus migulanus TaxID=47500 RepID=A0A0D1WN95_ANEMI|nr:TetR/AcrR family transcriptional regulator [Aneurinibacillus migulanus]KIV60110.1 transcriptional regulator [Aneurinibacillus migulanus]KON96774.1 transcriptional regulator [Aneurinibacillus migulanus]MED0893540.1 TetR/AcrR family transcriptional regulator [Aneurinibacillus migulanus]MED1616358.1 TetR/AcrR family transcriptional regulator [Aneurinibacillus migulanus]MED4729968.1 TetR/AcrR family transcriptional regulator [Aneurinibacillus migulanus]